MVQVILEDSDYSYDASEKQITLFSPYNSISPGQVVSIRNVTTGETIYDSREKSSLRIPRITISGGVLTHKANNARHSDTDTLQIALTLKQVDGGSA
jgi:hypothetical protein